MNRSKFAGKRVLVTGGASGIGRATAYRFAAAGAKVMIADLDRSKIDNVVREIEAKGGLARGVVADVSTSNSVASMVDATVQAFGGLDCAFNNAGIEQETGADLTWRRREEIWDRVIAVNLKGVWLCLQYEIERMISQGGGGAIVNTASVAGFRAVPAISQEAYVAGKHGVVGLTRAAAVEYAKSGIRVNAVAPGGTMTAMVERTLASVPSDQRGAVKHSIEDLHPMGRIGDPDEVARAVLWLCSADSSFTTGHVISVDGGWLAR